MYPVRRQISPHAANLRRNMTDAEKKLWSAMRDRRLGGYKFKRQATTGSFVVDFLCIEKRLVVEIDGGQHNEVVDALRTAFIEAQGYRIIRFWNNEVNESFKGVLDVILSRLSA